MSETTLFLIAGFGLLAATIALGVFTGKSFDYDNGWAYAAILAPLAGLCFAVSCVMFVSAYDAKENNWRETCAAQYGREVTENVCVDSAGRLVIVP